jgi:hypothetical protein
MVNCSAIKVLENNETQWILLNDDKDTISMLLQSCRSILNRLNILYNDNDTNIDDNNTPIDTNYDIETLCLKSNTFIKKDTVIFHEKPLVIAYGDDIETFNIAVKPLILKTIMVTKTSCDANDVDVVMSFFFPSNHIALLSSFSKLSLLTQNEILSLSSPLLKEIPQALTKALYYFTDLVLMDNAIKGFGLMQSPDVIVKLLLIFSANVFGTNVSDDGVQFVALFKRGCRINHSCCSSNANWLINNTKHRDLMLTFVSTRDIAVGEEITQCYFDRERWYSKHLRLSSLKASRYFNCNCTDCTSNTDVHRNFYCRNCNLLGSLIAVMSDNNSISLKCANCDNTPNKETTLSLLHKEKYWEEQAVSLAYDASISKLKEIECLYESIASDAPLHWTICEIADYLSAYSTKNIKKIGLIYRRINSLNYNSKQITNCAIGAIISYIKITQNLIESNKREDIDMRTFIKNELDFILKVNNISYTISSEDYDNHYIVFLVLVYITLQSLKEI